MEGGKLINDDASLIAQHASFSVLYRIVNPYAFELPISPHIASKQVGETVRFDKILEAFSELQNQSDIVLVEGVGGWEVPLNSEQTVAELATAFGLPVILVVGLRLGCLNHAILTYKAIIQADLICAGWIGNRIDPDFAFAEETIQTLQQKIDAPMLGSLPFNPELCPDVLMKHLNSSFFEQVG